MADSSDSLYGSVVGFIQFDVDEREYNDGVIRDVTIRSIASGDLFRISVWPDMDVELERGDFIAVDGKVDVRDVEIETDEGTITRTYTSMNARKIVRFPSITGDGPKVAKKSAASSGAAKRKTF